MFYTSKKEGRNDLSSRVKTSQQQDRKVKTKYIVFSIVALLVVAIPVKVYLLGGDTDPYNYRSYHSAHPDAFADRSLPEPGEKFPDAELHTLNGDTLMLSELWQERPLVLETGSRTCPIYIGQETGMEEVNTKYAQQQAKANVILLYTREAHPGMLNASHTSMEQKIANANYIRQRGVNRPIYIDQLDGTLHRQLGGMPNSVFVVGTDGIVIHSGSWNEPDKVVSSLEKLLSHGGRGENISELYKFDIGGPSHLSKADLMKYILKIILVGGPDALYDFVSSMMNSSD